MKQKLSLLKSVTGLWQIISAQHIIIKTNMLHRLAAIPIIQGGIFMHIFHRKQIVYFLLVIPLLLFSCIREEIQPCPPLQVRLTVKDKNYFNVNSTPLEAFKNESLPFREYIPTLYYSLRDAETGNIVEEQGVFNVTSDELTLPVTFCDCLPFGKYVLTVWGGLPDNTSLTDNSLTNIIHINGLEGSDVYLSHDTLVYDFQHTNYTFEMERVTGKLIVQVTNLPASVRYATKSISNLYERVNYKFGYQNSTTVNKSDSWNPTDEIVMHTILAPSTGELKSLLHLDLYEATPPAAPSLTPKDASITMKRNELTTLKYVYDDEKSDFSIYVFLNDGWEVIYDLNIN